MRFRLLVLLDKEISAKVEIAAKKEKIGSEYGGYWICPDNLSSRSIVYSIGIEKDITFDLSLIKKYNCNVFAFDPAPDTIEWVSRQNLPENFRFFPFGLADHDGKTVFYCPKNKSASLLELSAAIPIDVEVRRLSTLMKMLRHDSIDLLKLDVEGAEYLDIKDIFRSHLPINQICIEFHHRFPHCSVRDTLGAIQTLREIGFKLFIQDYDVFSFRR